MVIIPQFQYSPAMAVEAKPTQFSLNSLLLGMKNDLCQVVSPCLIKLKSYESLKYIDFV